MVDSPITKFRKLAAEANTTRRDILLVLGLTGPRNISQISELVRSAGLRESATRAFSTTTLRPILEVFIARGLVVQRDSEFDCARFVREQSIREAAKRGVLDRVATAIRTTAHPHLRYSTHGIEAAWFDFRVALHRGDLHNAASLLNHCATHNWERFVEDHPLVQAVCEPFDPVWLEKFRPRTAALLAWTLDHANRYGLPTHEMYPWLRDHISDLAVEVPALRLLFAEAALLRGDFSIVEAQLELPELRQSPDGTSLRATLAMLRGDDVAALDGFEKTAGLLQGQTGKKKTVVPLSRFFAVFHGLALLRRGRSDDISRVARQAAVCQRDKGYELQASARMLKHLAETAMSPQKADVARHQSEPPRTADCMSVLLRGLYAAWFTVTDAERNALLIHLIQLGKQLAAGQYTWLAEQHQWVAQRLYESLNVSMQTQPDEKRGFKSLPVPPCPEKRQEERPLVELFDTVPVWQMALQTLGQLAGMAREVETTDAAQERIAWRVSVGISNPIVSPTYGAITAEVCPGSPSRYPAARWEPALEPALR